MGEREYNLLDEPWLIALGNDGATYKASIPEVLERAAEFNGLAGEMPTQNAAVLRVLLAILHTVVSRYDENGVKANIGTATEAIRRWKAIWNQRRFPAEAVNRYLEQYHDRFYLIDPDRPFYQVPDIEYGTQYGTAKLNGELSESNNKVRLFPQRSGRAKAELDYDEAARWLVTTMAFDDAGAKKQGDNKAELGSMSVGWLGQIGLVMASGHNLFETLMLNLVLIPKGAGADIGTTEEHPEWEREDVRREQRSQIPTPDNLSQLYTIQSRRILLQRNGSGVIGYKLYGGDRFEASNALIEQMTCWKNIADKNTPNTYIPKQLALSGQFWKEFASLVSTVDGSLRPGVVDWIAILRRARAIQRGYYIGFNTLSTVYGNMQSSIDNVYSDQLAFDANLLSEMGESWVPTVIGEVEMSKKLVEALSYLAQCIAKASGGSSGKNEHDRAKESAYFALDIPFREWLESINAETDDRDEAANAWWDTARGIIRGIGRKLIMQAGPQALTGRMVKEKKKDKFYCAPDAYNSFLWKTSSRQTLMSGGTKDG